MDDFKSSNTKFQTMKNLFQGSSEIVEFQELRGLLIFREIRNTYYLFKSYQSEYSIEKIQVDRQRVFDRFREYLCKIHKKVESEYIIKLYDIKSFRTDFLNVFHEQYFKTLSDCMNCLTYNKKMSILSSIAQGLLALSKKQIVHNAVTPNSIAICEQDQNIITAKLGNFYYATQLKSKLEYFEKDERHKKLSEYSSPEMRFRDRIGLKSDVWSVGVIFYQFVFGKINISVKSSCVSYRLPEGTPSWLRIAFQGFLAFDPKNRYDISRVCQFLKLAVVSAEQAQKCLKDIKDDEWELVTV